MCDKRIEDMNTDELLELLVKAQRDKVEKMLNAQKESIKEKIEPKKEKAEEAIKSMLSLVFSPGVQGHFVKAGIEFLSGVEEIIKNAPMPDSVRENVCKACDLKDKVKDAVGDIGKQKTKDKKMKKIEVE
ncbi:MAG: hypothetical protein FWD92_06250 [Methanomassiliicoccaceae archaeon]|nr:hypothetical protein [Methanomassiliicoccaceae archaeon]